MKQRQFVGKTISAIDIVIEAGLVRRFVEALEITDPLSLDQKAAKAAGLTGLLLPTVAAGSLGDYDTVIRALELKPKQMLHSMEAIRVFERLCVGDEIKVTTSIDEVFEQQVGGNPMGFVDIKVIGTCKRSALTF